MRHVLETLATFGPLLAAIGWAAWQETKHTKPEFPKHEGDKR